MVSNGRVLDRNGCPRKNNLEVMSDEEKAIYDVIRAVEAVGAHPLLTDAVVLLSQAKDKLGEYVDRNYLSSHS